MIEEAIVEEIPGTEKAPAVKPKSKRDILRFEGDKPVAINLEHVTQVTVEENKITFQFYNTAMYVDFPNADATKAAFQAVLNIWAGESN